MLELVLLSMGAFQSDTPSVMTGRVVDAASGEAIRDATVMLNAMGGGREQPLIAPSGALANGRIGPLRAPRAATPQATTGADGSFRLTAAPGTYQLEAQGEGFAKYLHPKLVTLVKSQTLPPLALKLKKHAVISGRVAGEDGNPIAGARVTALVYQPFQHAAMQEAATVSNQAGEFRLAGLPPGQYLVTAQAPDLPGPNRGATFATAYFPGVSRMDAAERLDLASGGTRPGIDFRLKKVALVNVSGRVNNLPPVRPGPPGMRGGTDGLRLMLQPRDDASATSAPPALNERGEFLFSGVPSGSYTLVAISFSPNQERQATRLRLEVRDEDLTGVSATLAPLLRLVGRVVTPGRPARSGVIVALQPKRSQLSFPGNATSDERGRFQLYGLENDEYRPRVVDLPSGYYVRSIRQGAVDVQDTLDLTGGVTGELVITLDTATARISGRVFGKNRQPLAGAFILLLDSQPEMYTAQSTAKGEYLFEDLAPGDYLLGVTTDPNVLSPDVVEQVRKTGQRITLAPSGHEIRPLEVQ